MVDYPRAIEAAAAAALTCTDSQAALLASASAMIVLTELPGDVSTSVQAAPCTSVNLSDLPFLNLLGCRLIFILFESSNWSLPSNKHNRVGYGGDASWCWVLTLLVQ
jgi:hypothetical protein